MSYNFAFIPRHSRVFLVALLGALIPLFPLRSPAAEGAAGPSPTGRVDEAISPETRSYLQLQEQLHATQLAVERNRKESTETAIQTTEALTTGMKATTELSSRLKNLEESLSTQKSREWDVMQASNRTMLVVAGAFASFGFIALCMLGYFQWRTINRLAEISAILPRAGLALAGQRPRAALTAGDAIIASPAAHVTADSDLMHALARLEKRIMELEHGIGTPPDSDEEPITQIESNGNGDAGHPSDDANGASELTTATESTGNRVAVLLENGQSLLDAQKAEEALECFQRALAIEPQNPEALVKKGAALEKLRKLTEAIECYDQAIAADNTMTIAYLYKGGLCNRLERFNEALQCYEQALRTQEKRAA